MTKKHDIIWLNQVDSTNSEAARHISDLDNLSVLSAVTQSSGRGQRGNSWSSEDGQNLTFSIVLKFKTSESEPGDLPILKANEQFSISEITALSIIDFLADHGIIAKIKWPNDILVDGKKICGVLIENAVKGMSLSHSIIGIGLNINQVNFNVFTPEATSLILEAMKSRNSEQLGFDLRNCLDDFMEIFSSNYTQWLCEDIAGLKSLYHSHLWQLGEVSRYIDRKGCEPRGFAGQIRGVADNGLLLVENEEGELKEFAFKEISYMF